MNLYTAHRTAHVLLAFCLISIALGLVMIHLPAPVAHASNVTVTNTSDSGAGSLRNAIAIANPGDTIVFSLTLPATIPLSSQLVITKNLTISGPGANSLTISGNNSTRVISATGATLNLSEVTIANGNASGDGGGIYNNGTLNLAYVTLNGNYSYSDRGGGIYHGGGTANLTNVTLSGNYGHYGGGINVLGGGMTLLGSSVISNTSNYGGAIFLDGGTATFSNSTLGANAAYQYGGGVYINFGELYLNNATIANNYSDWDAVSGEDGGGIKHVGGTVYIQNTILANNYRWIGIGLPVVDDCKGTLNSADYNFIGTTSGCSFVGTTTNHKTGIPYLRLLENNGGATLTPALLPGSPAIDAGNVSGCKDQIAVPLLTDQRGAKRPIGPRCDIGAYEAGYLFLPLILK
jgi:hypothetical protein